MTAERAADGGSAATSSDASPARYAYALLAGVFAVCVLVQMYVAGMAVFVDPANWRLHTTFVHVFEPMLLLLLAVALLGRLPRVLQLAPVGLFVLVSLQYATAHLFGSLVAAVHPVNGVAIFLVAAAATMRAWQRA